MFLRRPCKCLKRASPTTWLFVALVTTLLLSPSLEAKTGGLGGVIFTVSSDHVQTVWPNARVALKNLDTNSESATVSDRLGTYAFAGVVYGHYEITVTLAGFESITRRLTIEAEHSVKASTFS